MSASPPPGLADEEVERLINGDDEPQHPSQEPPAVSDALDNAFHVLSQVTGASQQNNTQDGTQPTGEAVRAIWGSSLQVSDVMTRAFQFVRRFRKDAEDTHSDSYYVRIIGQVRAHIFFYPRFTCLVYV